MGTASRANPTPRRRVAALLCAGTICAAALGGGIAVAGAAPIIDTVGAVLDTGKAPIRGALEVNPNAPPATPPAIAGVPLPAPIAPMTGARPDFAGGAGSGSLGAFHATADATLAGGTLDYTTYTVDAGVTVTYSGPVTIRCTGDVALRGRVATSADGASVVFRCAGAFRTVSDGSLPLAGIATSGAGAGISIDAGTEFLADSTDEYQGPAIQAVAGDVAVRSGGAARILASASIETALGGVLVQAWGGDVVVSGFASVRSGGAATRVEASGGVTVTSLATVAAYPGTARLRAVGGPLIVENGSGTFVSDGDLVLEARDDVVVRSFCEISLYGGGALQIVSHDGDVRLGERRVDEEFDWGPDTSEALHDGSGAVLVHARGSVAFTGAAAVGAAQGDVEILAGADVRMNGGGRITSEQGGVTVRAAGAVSVRHDPAIEDSWYAYLEAAAVVVSCGEGGASLGGSAISAVEGACEVVSAGRIEFAGFLYARDGVTLRASSLGIDVARASIGTDSRVAVSGDILLETYEAPIDASASTILSGDATQESGEVRLLIHAARPVQDYVPPLPPWTAPEIEEAEADLLVTRASIRRERDDPSRWAVVLEGFAEGGLRGVGIETLGQFVVGGSTSRATRTFARGGRLRHRAESFDLTVVPPRRRDGRTRFALRLSADLGDAIDAEGNGRLALKFSRAVVAGAAEIELERGRYRLGTGRGSLVRPRVFVLGVSTAPRRDGASDVSVSACIANDAPAPATPLTLGLSVGGRFSATIAGAAAVAKGPGRFHAVRPAPGVESADIDYGRGLVRVALRAVDLGAEFTTPTVDLALAVVHGPDRRDARIRVARRGRVYRYDEPR